MIRCVVLWQAYLDRMTCKCFCDLEFGVINKVGVEIDASFIVLNGRARKKRIFKCSVMFLNFETKLSHS